VCGVGFSLVRASEAGDSQGMKDGAMADSRIQSRISVLNGSGFVIERRTE
jgi:hypothetical protein